MHAFSLAVVLMFSSAPDPDVEFFLAQARADPEMRIEDAYKGLFHATRGGEHALANKAAARQWLDEEWAALGPPQPNEPHWQPLASDGRIGRLNLRPYRAQGGSPDALHAAFLASAESFDASSARFRAAWKALGRALEIAPAGNLTPAEWRRLDLETHSKGYPAIHHSPEYEKSRQPAYRVLTAEEVRKLMDSLPSP